MLHWQSTVTGRRPLTVLSRISLSLLIVAGVLPVEAQQPAKKELPPAATLKVDFKRDIQAIFSSRCHQCHGSEMQMSSLRLDSRKDALAGGNSGPVIKPGNSAGSKLIQ